MKKESKNAIITVLFVIFLLGTFFVYNYVLQTVLCKIDNHDADMPNRLTLNIEGNDYLMDYPDYRNCSELYKTI